MKEKATWALILAGILLIVLGYSLGEFFQINYLIGGAGILMGFYNLYKEKT